MRFSVRLLWLTLSLLLVLSGCQNNASTPTAEAAEANDSLLTDDDLSAAEASADLPPVPFTRLPEDVQTLLRDLSASTRDGNQIMAKYVDTQYPVQYLHESNGPVANLDVLTAGEVLGINDLTQWLATYNPDSSNHFLTPPVFNACEPREPGVYLVNLQEPFTVLSSLYTNRMEDTGGELNPRKLEALRKVDTETRQILQVWRNDASGTLTSIRLFLRRTGDKLYISAIDATDCN